MTFTKRPSTRHFPPRFDEETIRRLVGRECEGEMGTQIRIGRFESTQQASG